MRQPLKTNALRQILFHRDGSRSCNLHGGNTIIGKTPDEICQVCDQNLQIVQLQDRVVELEKALKQWVADMEEGEYEEFYYANRLEPMKALLASIDKDM